MSKFITILFFTFTSILSFSQTSPGVQFVPYAQGNLGFQKPDLYTKNFGMANVGLAHYNLNSPNLKNPALLTYNKFTILDVNLGMSIDNLEFNGSSSQKTSGSINSLNLVMPFSYKWTSAISLTPSTSSHYSAETKTVFGNSTDTLIQSDTAFGGIQKIRWANGFNIYKNLNVGFAASYSFGNISKLIRTEVTGINSQIVNDFVSSKYSGFDFEVSAAHHDVITWQKADPDFIPQRDTIVTIKENGKIRNVLMSDLRKNANLEAFVQDTIIEVEKGKKNRKLRVGFGATYNSPLNWKREDVTINSNEFISVGDTSENGVGSPSKLALGISIGSLSRNNSWSLAFDYEMETGYKYEVGTISNDVPASTRMSVGFQYTPQIESENFFKKTSFSMGAYQAKTPYTYNNEQLEEVGMHFGISFVDRAKRSNESFRWRAKSKKRLNYLSRYNFGMGVGTLGGDNTSAFQQAFIKFNFGVSLNSEWFVRRKIN